MPLTNLSISQTAEFRIIAFERFGCLAFSTPTRAFMNAVVKLTPAVIEKSSMINHAHPEFPVFKTVACTVEGARNVSREFEKTAKWRPQISIIPPYRTKNLESHTRKLGGRMTSSEVQVSLKSHEDRKAAKKLSSVAQHLANQGIDRYWIHA
ncbi:hypothetical protein RF11_11849 [Thelohanellus kitauei]|uniref:Uncharacterized protein n=1 Tax=Thelohanellus kitauei TaxID=669202 RepID=A0A0C2NFT4_THEKT|nr:hypothetical protein RF11_11849 [Thelohanellus kitauei]